VVSDAKPPYPPEALPYSPDASVWVSVNIDANGKVAEAKAARWRLSIERSIDDPNYWASKPERPFIDAAEAAAQRWEFAPPDANTRTSVELLFTFRNVRTPPPAAAVVPPPAAAATNGSKVLRVGNGIKPPIKIADVKPIYPASAMAQHIQGVVILDVRIAGDGSVADATIVRSIAALDDAALTAVRQWRFVPTLLNGEPVEVLMTVTVNFTL
jgi:protein TonB